MQMFSLFVLSLTAILVVAHPVPADTILFNINDSPAQRSAAIQALLQQRDVGPDLARTLWSLTPAGTSGITGTSLDSWRIVEKLAELVARRRRRRMEKTLHRMSHSMEKTLHRKSAS